MHFFNSRTIGQKTFCIFKMIIHSLDIYPYMICHGMPTDNLFLWKECFLGKNLIGQKNFLLRKTNYQWFDLIIIRDRQKRLKVKVYTW